MDDENVDYVQLEEIETEDNEDIPEVQALPTVKPRTTLKDVGGSEPVLNKPRGTVMGIGASEPALNRNMAIKRIALEAGSSPDEDANSNGVDSRVDLVRRLRYIVWTALCQPPWCHVLELYQQHVVLDATSKGVAPRDSFKILFNVLQGFRIRNTSLFRDAMSADARFFLRGLRNGDILTSPVDYEFMASVCAQAVENLLVNVRVLQKYNFFNLWAVGYSIAFSLRSCMVSLIEKRSHVEKWDLVLAFAFRDSPVLHATAPLLMEEEDYFYEAIAPKRGSGQAQAQTNMSLSSGSFVPLSAFLDSDGSWARREGQGGRRGVGGRRSHPRPPSIGLMYFMHCDDDNSGGLSLAQVVSGLRPILYSIGSIKGRHVYTPGHAAGNGNLSNGTTFASAYAFNVNVRAALDDVVDYVNTRGMGGIQHSTVNEVDDDEDNETDREIRQRYRTKSIGYQDDVWLSYSQFFALVTLKLGTFVSVNGSTELSSDRVDHDGTNNHGTVADLRVEHMYALGKEIRRGCMLRMMMRYSTDVIARRAGRASTSDDARYIQCRLAWHHVLGKRFFRSRLLDHAFHARDERLTGYLDYSSLTSLVSRLLGPLGTLSIFEGVNIAEMLPQAQKSEDNRRFFSLSDFKGLVFSIIMRIIDSAQRKQNELNDADEGDEGESSVGDRDDEREDTNVTHGDADHDVGGEDAAPVLSSSSPRPRLISSVSVLEMLDLVYETVEKFAHAWVYYKGSGRRYKKILTMLRKFSAGDDDGAQNVDTGSKSAGRLAKKESSKRHSRVDDYFIYIVMPRIMELRHDPGEEHHDSLYKGFSDGLLRLVYGDLSQSIRSDPLFKSSVLFRDRNIPNMLRPSHSLHADIAISAKKLAVSGDPGKAKAYAEEMDIVARRVREMRQVLLRGDQLRHMHAWYHLLSNFLCTLAVQNRKRVEASLLWAKNAGMRSHFWEDVWTMTTRFALFRLNNSPVFDFWYASLMRFYRSNLSLYFDFVVHVHPHPKKPGHALTSKKADLCMRQLLSPIANAPLNYCTDKELGNGVKKALSEVLSGNEDEDDAITSAMFADAFIRMWTCILVAQIEKLMSEETTIRPALMLRAVRDGAAVRMLLRGDVAAWANILDPLLDLPSIGYYYEFLRNLALRGEDVRGSHSHGDENDDSLAPFQTELSFPQWKIVNAKFAFNIETLCAQLGSSSFRKRKMLKLLKMSSSLNKKTRSKTSATRSTALISMQATDFVRGFVRQLTESLATYNQKDKETEEDVQMMVDNTLRWEKWREKLQHLIRKKINDELEEILANRSMSYWLRAFRQEFSRKHNFVLICEVFDLQDENQSSTLTYGQVRENIMSLLNPLTTRDETKKFIVQKRSEVICDDVMQAFSRDIRRRRRQKFGKNVDDDNDDDDHEEDDAEKGDNDGDSSLTVSAEFTKEDFFDAFTAALAQLVQESVRKRGRSRSKTGKRGKDKEMKMSEIVDLCTGSVFESFTGRLFKASQRMPAGVWRPLLELHFRAADYAGALERYFHHARSSVDAIIQRETELNADDKSVNQLRYDLWKTHFRNLFLPLRKVHVSGGGFLHLYHLDAYQVVTPSDEDLQACLFVDDNDEKDTKAGNRRLIELMQEKLLDLIMHSSDKLAHVVSKEFEAPAHAVDDDGFRERGAVGSHLGDGSEDQNGAGDVHEVTKKGREGNIQRIAAKICKYVQKGAHGHVLLAKEKDIRWTDYLQELFQGRDVVENIEKYYEYIDEDMNASLDIEEIRIGTFMLFSAIDMPGFDLDNLPTNAELELNTRVTTWEFRRILLTTIVNVITDNLPSIMARGEQIRKNKDHLFHSVLKVDHAARASVVGARDAPLTATRNEQRKVVRAGSDSLVLFSLDYIMWRIGEVVDETTRKPEDQKSTGAQLLYHLFTMTFLPSLLLFQWAKRHAGLMKGRGCEGIIPGAGKYVAGAISLLFIYPAYVISHIIGLVTYYSVFFNVIFFHSQLPEETTISFAEVYAPLGLFFVVWVMFTVRIYNNARMVDSKSDAWASAGLEVNGQMQVTYFEGMERFARESPVEYAEALYQKVQNSEKDTWKWNRINQVVWAFFALLHAFIPTAVRYFEHGEDFGSLFDKTDGEIYIALMNIIVSFPVFAVILYSLATANNVFRAQGRTLELLGVALQAKDARAGGFLSGYIDLVGAHKQNLDCWLFAREYLKGIHLVKEDQVTSVVSPAIVQVLVLVIAMAARFFLLNAKFDIFNVSGFFDLIIVSGYLTFIVLNVVRANTAYGVLHLKVLQMIRHKLTRTITQLVVQKNKATSESSEAHLSLSAGSAMLLQGQGQGISNESGEMKGNNGDPSSVSSENYIDVPLQRSLSYGGNGSAVDSSAVAKDGHGHRGVHGHAAQKEREKHTVRLLENEIEELSHVATMLESSISKIKQLDEPITLVGTAVDEEFLVKILSTIAAGVGAAFGAILEEL